MDEFDNERQLLFDRFSQSLKDRTQQYFFDEDDIVEIFDYAGDLNNDFVRAEALMYGARYYPDSERLRQRRALFYTDTLQSENTEGLEDVYATDSNMLTKLSLMRIRPIGKDMAKEQLRHLVDDCETMDDEETIRLVGVADEYDLLDWIDSNLEYFKSKTSNKAALIYELAYSLSENNPDRAAELFEVLVEDRPYVADYWQLLARAQFNSSGYKEKADESLDMALAIDPDNNDAWLLKAQIIAMNPLAPEHREIMAKIYERLPMIPDVVLTYLHTMDAASMRDLGVKILLKHLRENQYISVPLYESLLILDPEAGLGMFDEVINSTGISLSDFEPIVWHVAAANTDTALELCQLILSHSTEDEQRAMLWSMSLAMFVYARFDAVISLTDRCLALQSADIDVERHITLIRAISFYKMKKFDNAMMMAQKYLSYEQPDDGDSFPAQGYWNRVNFIGAQTCAHVLVNLCTPEGRVNNDPDDFTFAGLWH